jgi:hypothetical protein
MVCGPGVTPALAGRAAAASDQRSDRLASVMARQLAFLDPFGYCATGRVSGGTADIGTPAANFLKADRGAGEPARGGRDQRCAGLPPAPPTRARNYKSNGHADIRGVMIDEHCLQAGY